ncbi:MAG: BamA/TamA family outer membrane protein [Chlorobiales bacterium]|nr:BamA/TamA family outer membrane protein [Chlorobiales bacterium]
MFLLILLSPLIHAQNKSGNRLTLARVEVSGGGKINPEKLMPLFSLSVPYDSVSFSQSLERMRGIYQNFGFYDFRIDSLRQEIDAASNRLKITLYVTEGEVSTVSEITITGNRMIPASELLDLMNTRKDDVLDTEVLEKDFGEILKKYEQIGRPFAKISLEKIERLSADTLQEHPPSLRIALEIAEGPFVRIAGYKISGNKATEPEVITRELDFYPGEAFNGQKFDQTKQRIEKLGYFEKVNEPGLSAIMATSKTDTLDGIIEFSVVESNQNTFDGIVGYQPARTASERGFFTGYVNISLRNMFGTGRELGVLWNKPDKLSQDIKLRYLEPWLFGIPLNAAFSFRQLKQDTTFSQIDLALNMTYRVSGDFYIMATVAHEAINPIFERENQAQSVLKSRKIVTGLGFIYDSRDYPRNPRSGLLFRNEYLLGNKVISSPDSVLELYGIKKKMTQQRILLDLEFYKQLFHRQVIAVELHGMALIASQIEISDLFRFGGSHDLRGYREQQFMASQLIYSNIEYRFLLSRDTFAFLFCDLAYFYKPPNPLNSLDGSFNAYKTGYGFGVRLETPLGILGVSYALGEKTSFLDGLVHFGIINEF